jgi:glyoxylase-like metal-dependent hydrolase (beta-lactamase superfamily II)
MKILRIVAGMTVGLVLIGLWGWSYLTEREPVPQESDYVIDLDALAQLARSGEEPLPLEVRHEVVATSQLPRAGVFAGESFEPHTMTHGVYQVVYPSGFLLIDVSFGRELFDSQMAEGGQYDDAAFERVRKAMARARLIVLTHEHADHIEGLASVVDRAGLVGRLVMNERQHGNPQSREILPPELLDSIEPIRYEGMHLVAPGVVLLAAAGHTPGSQIVYLTTQDGAAYLFIGDVAWHMDALRELHYRPRLVTDYFLGEDRAAVLAQFRALHDLLDNPDVEIVVSHDGEQRADLVRRGRLREGLMIRPASG